MIECDWCDGTGLTPGTGNQCPNCDGHGMAIPDADDLTSEPRLNAHGVRHLPRKRGPP
jgi:hypothetical protein